MKQVDKSELLALGAYEQIRDRFRQRIIELKKRRRVAIGPHMSLVFENHDTALLQIQEMLRTERISDDRAIAHELETYNELLAQDGGVCGTLFIEYDDAAERRVMLGHFATLRDQLHLVIGGHKTTARFATHFGEEMDRLPAVNYLTFEVGKERAAVLRDASVPATLEVSHPDYRQNIALTPELRGELALDLES
jgi:hypothetical protein